MDDRRLRSATGSGQRPFDDVAMARRFQRRLGEVRPPARYGRPTLQYTESGYPIDNGVSLAARVRRLITG